MDLTVDNKQSLHLSKGVIYNAIFLRWKNRTSTPDNAYVMTLKEWNLDGTDMVLTMGNGITVDNGNTVIIDIGVVHGAKSLYKASFNSVSKVYGVAFCLKINIIVKDHGCI